MTLPVPQPSLAQPVVGRRDACVVSDAIVYRTLLHGGLARLEEVSRAVKLGRCRGRSFQERVWTLVLRHQHLQTDRRTVCALTGQDGQSYAGFLRAVRGTLRSKPVHAALRKVFPRKVHQLGRDLKLADDFDFFFGGGLNLRDEIELARMWVERHDRHFFDDTTWLRDMDFVDALLRRRLERFLTSHEPFAAVGPKDGFKLETGLLPRRFWWRFYAPQPD